MTKRGEFLLHPITLAMLALWVLNDHVLKQAFPGFLTGKLSDVAGLAVFPLLPVAVLEGLRGRAMPSNAALIASCLATGAAIVAIKLFDPAADCYRWGLAALQWPFRSIAAGELASLAPVSLAMDPSDCLTLPALGLALAVGWRSRPERARVPALA
jgi:hypothetical protein